MIRLPMRSYADVLHRLIECVPSGEIGRLVSWRRQHLALRTAPWPPDWFHALLALAALFVPLGFARLVLSRTARRHEHTAPGARTVPRDEPMR